MREMRCRHRTASQGSSPAACSRWRRRQATPHPRSAKGPMGRDGQAGATTIGREADVSSAAGVVFACTSVWLATARNVEAAICAFRTSGRRVGVLTAADRALASTRSCDVTASSVVAWASACTRGSAATARNARAAPSARTTSIAAPVKSATAGTACRAARVPSAVALRRESVRVSLRNPYLRLQVEDTGRLLPATWLQTRRPVPVAVLSNACRRLLPPRTICRPAGMASEAPSSLDHSYRYQEQGQQAQQRGGRVQGKTRTNFVAVCSNSSHSQCVLATVTVPSHQLRNCMHSFQNRNVLELYQSALRLPSALYLDTGGVPPPASRHHPPQARLESPASFPGAVCPPTLRSQCWTRLVSITLFDSQLRTLPLPVPPSSATHCEPATAQHAHPAYT